MGYFSGALFVIRFPMMTGMHSDFDLRSLSCRVQVVVVESTGHDVCWKFSDLRYLRKLSSHVQVVVTESTGQGS